MARAETRGEFVSSFAAQGAASAGQFAVTLLLAQGLGLARFGAVAAVVLGGIWAAGLTQALVAQPHQSLVGARGSAARERTFALTAGAALSAALGAGALGLAVLLGPALPVPPLAVGALVTARALVPVLRAASFAARARRWTVAGDVVGALLGIVLVGAVLWRDGGAGAAVCALAAASLGGATLHGLGALRTRGTRLTAARARVLLRRHWELGRWLALNQVASWLGTGSFHVAAAAHAGLAGLGALRAAQTVVGAVGTGVQALDLALPRVVAGRGDLHELPGALPRLAGGAALAFAVPGAVLFALAGPIAGWLGGASPGETAAALRWLALGPAIAAASAVHQVGLRAQGRTRGIFVAYIASASAAAVSAPALAQAHGIQGAAMGLMAGQLFFLAGLAAAWRTAATTGRLRAMG